MYTHPECRLNICAVRGRYAQYYADIAAAPIVNQLLEVVTHNLIM